MPPTATGSRSAAFEWNAGAWFGAQLGGTAWLFVSSAVLLRGQPRSALVLLGCGLGANLLGSLLWMQRGRLSPYRALQILVTVCCGFAFVAVRWLDLHGELALLDPRVGPRSDVRALAGPVPGAPGPVLRPGALCAERRGLGASRAW